MHRKLLHTLEKRFKKLLIKDRIEFQNIARKIRRHKQADSTVEHLLEKLRRKLDTAEQRSLKAVADAIKFSYPPGLPISDRVDDIKQSIMDNQVVIICGSTGSGKTTQLPKIALDLGLGRFGRIGCTQPRRLAATAMAKRVAAELEVKCGDQVGFHVRFNKRTNDQTVIKFMTDGILLSETQNDPDLLQYDTIIVDEAHERSLNIDFILGYLKQLKQRRPELKIIISSATLDADNFSQFFDNAPIMTIEGRTFPVDDYFMPPNEDEELALHIMRAVRWISDIDANGDILVFLAGEREIRDARDMLEGRNIPDTEILPLFGRLSMNEQQRVFAPGPRRRIILATNVAETSITIPNIHYVIDSGEVRISRYNPRNHIQGLQIEQVSQASAKQRRGRCGRIAEGICVYLYSEETLAESPEFTDPEIRRTSLAGVILQMSILGLKKIEHFPFIDPPQKTLIREGYQTLRDINAIDKRGKILPAGRKIAGMPLDPHLGRMIIEGGARHVLPEMIIITAFLSMQDPRERPLNRQAAADQAHTQWRDAESDFIGILNLWNCIIEERGSGRSNSAFKRYCRNNFLNFLRVREWLNLCQDLARAITENDMPKINILATPLGEPDYDNIHKSILAGVPANIGMYDRDEKNYISTRSRKFYIFPGSTLHGKKPPPQWVMTFALVSTTRIFARQVAEIKSSWLEDVAPHLCKSIYDKIKWDKRKGFVYAREMVSSGGLLIHQGRRIHYGSVCPAEAREVFIRDAVVYGRMFSRHKWLKKHQQMIRDVKSLEEKIRRPDSMWDADAVFEHFDKLLPPHVCSTKSLEKWLYKSKTNINMAIEDAMILQLSPVNPDDYPDFISFTGHQFELLYSFDPGEPDDGVAIKARHDEINLIPAWGLDWLVPGYLPEKVEAMIKALPKEQRRVCNPAALTAEKFTQAVNDNNIFTQQPLNIALADFLSELTGEIIKPSDFDMDRLRESMFMKIAEINEDGYIVDFHRELPEHLSSGSMLSAAVNGAEKWMLTGLQEWPEEDVPERIILSGGEEREVYPALSEEAESVGRQIFMDRREADYEHKHGLVKLFCLNYPQQIKYLRKSYPLSPQIQLVLCLKDHEKKFEQDFIYSIILAALTDDGYYDIRHAEDFELRSQAALENMGSVADKYLEILEKMLEQYAQIRSMLDKIDSRGKCGCDDIKQHLTFLFRTGFMNNETVLKNYPRYLRALQLRTERLNSAPLKDHEKMEPLIPFIERFNLALTMVDNLEKSFDLFDFWLSFEELRIATFAPEVRTTEKISPLRLQDKWDELRL